MAQSYGVPYGGKRGANEANAEARRRRTSEDGIAYWWSVKPLAMEEDSPQSQNSLEDRMYPGRPRSYSDPGSLRNAGAGRGKLANLRAQAARGRGSQSRVRTKSSRPSWQGIASRSQKKSTVYNKKRAWKIEDEEGIQDKSERRPRASRRSRFSKSSKYLEEECQLFGALIPHKVNELNDGERSVIESKILTMVTNTLSRMNCQSDEKGLSQ